MDNGEVIPGLNEDWTFAGAKMFEWIAGFMMLLLATEFLVDKPAKAAPLLVCIMIGTTLGMATLRRSFPDEERGVRNYMCALMGFAPPGIPAPSMVQPIWSGAPMRKMDNLKAFMALELNLVFEKPKDEEDETDDNQLVV